jgi:hypothetical protein
MRRKVAHSAAETGAAIIALLLLSGSTFHGAEPVQPREHLGAMPVAKTSTASVPHNFFEISSCSASVKDDANSQPYSYSTHLSDALELLKQANGLKSEIEASGQPPEMTRSKYQHPKHDHYDVVEIEEKQEGSDAMIVTLRVWSYWKDDTPSDHPHNDHTLKTFQPCNVRHKGWEECRDERIKAIVGELQGLDITHQKN